MRIGFAGLGLMGGAIAANMLKGGFALTVWNRSPDKAAPLAAQGAKVADNPRALAGASDIVFSMLADDDALEAVLEGEQGLLAGLVPGALHSSMSTIAVTTADSMAARHAERGQSYISTPVFGRPDVAAAAKLFVVAAGRDADIDRAEPALRAIGQKLFRVGETPSAANLVKLCGNFMLLSAVEAMAEAMALAEKGGVPKATLYEVISGTLFDALAYRSYGPILVEERFRPAGFPAPLGLKDMRLVGAAAEANRVAMPLLSLVRDHLLETIAKEGSDVDWSAIGLTVARNAGL
jgi:3-hydroxyisobutyrate dehydrogenase-like beta-hydroxyacid dehydrogenase